MIHTNHFTPSDFHRSAHPNNPAEYAADATGVVSAVFLARLGDLVDDDERPRIRVVVPSHGIRHPRGLRMHTDGMSELLEVDATEDNALTHGADGLMLLCSAANGDGVIVPVSEVTAIELAAERPAGFVNTDWKTLVTAEDVPEELLDHAVEVADSWYPGRIDWDDMLDRLDGFETADGTRLDLGADTGSGAIKAIKAHVRQIRKDSPR